MGKFFTIYFPMDAYMYRYMYSSQRRKRFIRCINDCDLSWHSHTVSTFQPLARNASMVRPAQRLWRLDHRRRIGVGLERAKVSHFSINERFGIHPPRGEED